MPAGSHCSPFSGLTPIQPGGFSAGHAPRRWPLPPRRCDRLAPSTRDGVRTFTPPRRSQTALAGSSRLFVVSPGVYPRARTSTWGSSHPPVPGTAFAPPIPDPCRRSPTAFVTLHHPPGPASRLCAGSTRQTLGAIPIYRARLAAMSGHAGAADGRR